MEVDITSKETQQSLKRTRVTARVSYTQSPTPSRKQLTDVIATKVGAKPDVVVITKVAETFGNNTCTVSATVYQTTADRDAAESKHLLKRSKLIEEKDDGKKSV